MSQRDHAASNVLLVSMPWAALHSPSIQLGTIQSLLADAAIPCRTLPAGPSFMRWLNAAGVTANDERWTVDDYDYAANYCHTEGLGEWVFADHSPVGSGAWQEYWRVLVDAGVSERAVRLATLAREVASVWLDQLADRIVASAPRVVGFSMMFSQTMPSMQLARRLKARRPQTAIVCGGANCDAEMGHALIDIFPDIDVVVRGEAENVVVDVFRALLEGVTVPPLPGLCIRDRQTTNVVPFSGDMVPMKSVPKPDYRNYFEELELSGLTTPLRDRLVIPFESARGCWWGEKSHCTFCGLNGHTMKFRSKEPASVCRELVEMAHDYECVRFVAVDNIIDLDYFKTLLPALAATGVSWELFYETKGNLKRWQLEMFAAGGVTRIQPGLESLSTPVLKLMAKGISALQNIYVLKWSAYYGIRVAWNIIAGIPGEPPAEYARMADISRSLLHLDAPNMCLLAVDRFSPYHKSPEQFGIRITGPRPFYRFVFGDLGPQLTELAYSFEYEYADNHDPRDYIDEMKRVVEHWRDETSRTYKALKYVKGPDWIEIIDFRDRRKRKTIRLNGFDARLFEACNEIHTPASACQACGAEPTASNIEAARGLFDELVRLRAMVCEAGRYLNVAVPPRQNTAATWQPHLGVDSASLGVPATA